MEGATFSSCAPDGSRESVKCQVRQEACVPSILPCFPEYSAHFRCAILGPKSQVRTMLRI